jgi:hypothetical protein
MPFIADFYKYAKENSIIFGIIFSNVITFMTYIISFGISVVFFGDIHIFIGTAIGLYFALKYKNPEQSPLLYGILGGVVSSILSAFTLTLFQWAYIFMIIIEVFFIYLIPAIIIGPILGIIFGIYFWRKEAGKDEETDSEFWESLKEKNE